MFANLKQISCFSTHANVSYIIICTYTRTHTHTHTHARTHTHIHTRTHARTHAHTHRESSITCTFCSVVALRRVGLNNKKQRIESYPVSCFISTSNALAMERPGYHDMKGWREDKPSHDYPLSSTLGSCHTSIVVFRKIGQ